MADDLAFKLVSVFARGVTLQLLEATTAAWWNAPRSLPRLSFVRALADARDPSVVRKLIRHACRGIRAQMHALPKSPEGAEIMLLAGCDRAALAATLADGRLFKFWVRLTRMDELAERIANVSDPVEVRAILATEIQAAAAYLDGPGDAASDHADIPRRARRRRRVA